MNVADGVAQGISAQDFDRDGDLDMVLGRGATVDGSTGYYSNTQDPADGVITVSLQAQGSGNNELGIGSMIRVASTDPSGQSYNQVRMVDGGSGRSNQSPMALDFGIAGTAADSIEVTWPDGWVQTIYDVQADQDVVFVDDHYPVGVGSTAVASYSPSTGYTEYVFECDSMYSVTRIEVVLEHVQGNDPSCFAYPAVKGQPASITLTPDTPGVSTASAFDPSTGRFHNRLVWSEMCVAPCNYTYSIKLYSAGRKSSTSSRTLNVSVCAQIQQG